MLTRGGNAVDARGSGEGGLEAAALCPTGAAPGGRDRSPRHGLSRWLIDGYGRTPADLRGWQRACDSDRARMRRTRMPDLVRRYIAIPQVPVKVLLSAATLASFGWLLAHGLVHPVVIYALQLY